MVYLKDMSQAQLISWIQTLGLSYKQDIIDGINEYAAESEVEITGSMFILASRNDIIELTNEKLNIARATAFLQKIAAKKDADYQAEAPTEEPGAGSGQMITFILKITASKTYNIPGANPSWTIAKCKQEFLRFIGKDGKAELYADHANEKWASPNKKDGIELKRDGRNLGDRETLESLGIINGIHLPLVTAFRVNGGAEAKATEQDEYDKIRPRKLNKKKMREAGIKLSKKPDCIMGYNDSDGIPRAEMPCGCAFASDTMHKYMLSLFDKDLKAVRPICPMPKSQCKGNDKQRIWPWGLVFFVADLSKREEDRFTKAIDNRLSSTKNCPHCGSVTERNDDVRISRVNCSACSGSDWCWNCTKKWNHSGLGPICGNKGCMADRLNELLKPENCGTTTTYWSDVANKGATIVQTRACPKCLTLLEYVAACKQIKCITCPHQFCFNCLGDWKSGQCSHSIKCNYAGPQYFS